jgi:hypothetical protein
MPWTAQNPAFLRAQRHDVAGAREVACTGFGSDSGSASRRIVVARSDAEIPVPIPS